MDPRGHPDAREAPKPGPGIAHGGPALTGVVQLTVTTIIFGLPSGQRTRETRITLPSATATVAELIARKVGREVEEHAADPRRGLGGEHLSPERLIRADPANPLAPGPIDEERESALRAFIAGEYMIVIDDRRVRDPETMVTLGPETRVEFIKILPLVGG